MRGGRGGVSSATLGAARRLSDSVLAEFAQWLEGTACSPDESRHREAGPFGDEEFIRSVWQEVGDDLRDAMREYPLDRAASDARQRSRTRFTTRTADLPPAGGRCDDPGRCTLRA